MPEGIPGVELEIAWGPQSATLDNCAEATLDFLCRLGPFFAGLHRTRLVTTRKKRTIQLDVFSMKEVLLTGVNRDDVDHEVIPELGYSVGLTTMTSTTPSYEVDVELNIGVTSPAVANEVRIALGTFDPVPPEQLAAIDWIGILELMVDVWSPRYGSLLTSAVSSRPRLRKALRVGWLTYLSAREFPELPLPAGVAVKPIRGAGHIINGLPDRFPQHSKKDLALITQVHRSLASRYLDVKSL